MVIRVASSVMALGLAAAFLALPVSAQQPDRPPCGDRADLLSQLKDKYHEAPTGFGMTANGAVVELMTGESGSWTLVLTYPNGRSCMMAAGEGWELWQAHLAGKGA